jgi:MFS family permease
MPLYIRLRVSTIFLVHGLVVSTWVSRIPAIQTSLKLAPGTLGLTLLAAAVGSLVSMPLTGMLIDREGSGPVTTQSSIGFCLTLPLLALASNAWWLAGALFLYGFAAGAMDVGMNAQAVAVEQRCGRSMISSFHALFSAGGMLGSAAGGFIAARGINPLPHYLAAAAILLLVALAAARDLFEDHQHVDVLPSTSPFRLPGAVVALAAIAFIFFMTEGAVADWSAIYLREFNAAGPGTAALGYAAFSVAMAIGRFTGDAVIEKLGRRRTLEVFSLVAAAGLALAVAGPNTAVALAGFALTGAGCCVIVPVAFASAGRIAGLSKGIGMAAVTGAGYLGLVLGPPLIGFTAQAVTLRTALLLVVALSASAALIASKVKESASPSIASGARPD